MTNDGFNRLCNIFVADIDKVTYELDGILKEKTISRYTIESNKLILYINVSDIENGRFDKFKVVGKTGIIYSDRALTFNKSKDNIIIQLPFTFIQG